MGLLSKLVLLFYGMAIFRFKRQYTKAEHEAAIEAAVNVAYETGYEAGYDAANKAGSGCEYEYGYQYYGDLHTPYECERDSECLESGKPKCVTGKCQELSGGVLLMGGFVSNSESSNVAKIGNCAAGNIVDLPAVMSYGAAAAVLDGLVHQCGGRGNSVAHTNKCYVRSPAGLWTEGPHLQERRNGLTLNKVGSSLVAIGGDNRDGLLDSIEILEPGRTEWQKQSYTISPARSQPCAVTVSSTQVILAGGGISYLNYLPNTEMININTGSITRYADLPLKLCDGACVLHQGKILLAGGYTSAKEGSRNVYLLDYSNQGNSWIKISSMVSKRYGFSIVVIRGVPTAFGGVGASASMEKYEGGVWKSQVFTPSRYDQTSVVIC